MTYVSLWRRETQSADINGKAVIDGRELELTVSRMSPGSMVNLKSFRGGQQKQVAATLGHLRIQRLSNYFSKAIRLLASFPDDLLDNSAVNWIAGVLCN